MEVLGSAPGFIVLHDPVPGQIEGHQNARVYVYLYLRVCVRACPHRPRHWFKAIVKPGVNWHF